MPQQDKMTLPPPPKTLGYELSNLPAFIRPANVNTKIDPAAQQLLGGGTVVADVQRSNPTTIQVREPGMFTQPVQTHESTHVYQFSRNPQFIDNATSAANTTTGKNFASISGYGGIEGLEQAINNRKTIANFNAEQQAEMVADFQKLTGDALKKGDRKALARVTAAYHPFVSQLASIPPKGADMTKMTRQDLTPAAPSVPPATVIGVPLTADPLIGGAAGPKVNDTKRFENGRMAFWDGHGWRAKTQ